MSSSTIHAGDETGRIEVKNDNFTVEWIIENFSRLPQGRGDHIFSPDFDTVNGEVGCYISLYPQGDDDDEVDHVGIYLHVNPSEANGNTHSQMNVEFSIFPSGITRKLGFTYVDRYQDGLGQCNVIRRSELQKLCAPDDTVTIRFKVEIPWETKNKTNCTEQAFDSPGGQLSQAFRPLFKESTFSDISVIVGTHKIPAHKLVLAARSPVFSAMFRNKKTRENLNKEVKIEEMEPDVVEAMLEFFYTDEVTNLKELACGLLGAAEKYDVPHLRSMCEKFLYKTLNTENAAEILIHTDLYRSLILKQHVIEFMVEHLSDVVETEGYKEMKEKYPALVNELIDSIADRQKVKKRRLE